MSGFLYSVGGFIVAIAILVAVHEFGHFWVAKKLGVKVLRFSIGFGKPLWTKRSGPDNTEYQLAMIPLGGYVKMLDESEGDVAPNEVHRAFNRQPLWKRIAIVLAGPLFNFLFAIVAYWAVYINGVEDIEPTIGSVVSQSLAEKSGFRPGDKILSIDGRQVRGWSDQRLYLIERALQQDQTLFRVEDQQHQQRDIELDLSTLNARQINGALMSSAIGLRVKLPPLTTEVGSISPGKPAAEAGLLEGDLITELDGKSVISWQQLVDIIRPKSKQPVSLTYLRNQQSVTINIIPQEIEHQGKKLGVIGIGPSAPTIPDSMKVLVDYGPLDALIIGIEQTWRMSSVTLQMLYKMLKLQISAKNISGPLTIAQYAGDTVQIGLQQFILFLAVISISLGVLNLLPIPVLDGGHLLYYLIEGLTGKPVSERVLLVGQQLGIFLLFALMSLAFYNDIVRLLR